LAQVRPLVSEFAITLAPAHRWRSDQAEDAMVDDSGSGIRAARRWRGIRDGAASRRPAAGPEPSPLLNSTVRPRVAVIGGGGEMGLAIARMLTAGEEADRWPRSVCLVDHCFSPAVRETVAGLYGQGDGAPIWLFWKAHGQAAAHLMLSCASSSLMDGTEPAWGAGGLSAPWAATAVWPQSPRSRDALARWVTRRCGRLVRANEVAAAIERATGPKAVVHLARAAGAGPYPGGCDFAVFCLHYRGEEEFRQAVRPYVELLGPGALAVDISAQKAPSVEILEQLLARDRALLGIHPLFGPAVNDVVGKVVAVTPSQRSDRAGSRWDTWLRSRLHDLGLILEKTSPRRHDAAMAYVQQLTHFVLLSLAACLRAERGPDTSIEELLRLRTPVFEPLVYLSARVAALAGTNPTTYVAIQQQRSSTDVRHTFLEWARRISESIASAQDGDEASLRSILDWLAGKADAGGVPSGPLSLPNVIAVTDGFLRRSDVLRGELVRSRGEVRIVADESTDPATFRAVQLAYGQGSAPPGAGCWLFTYFPVDVRVGQIEHGDGTVATEGAGLRTLPLVTTRLVSDVEFLVREAAGDGLTFETPPVDLWLPDWFDQEILTRLLRGVGSATNFKGRVQRALLLAPRGGSISPTGYRAWGVAFRVIVHPEDVVRHRCTAIRRLYPDARPPDADEVGVRQDFSLASSLTTFGATPEAQLGARAAVDDAVRQRVAVQVRRMSAAAHRWLLRHGGRRPTGPRSPG
jgi:prephenate dehydrogenase